MSKLKLKLDKLKPEALNATGRQLYGMDEYTYIKAFSYDDNNAIKVNFYVLVKVDETTFDLIANISSPDYNYNIADGKSFTDISGNNVYTVDENGDIVYVDVEVESLDEDGESVTVTESQPVKREDDYSRNFGAFAALMIPSINNDIKHYLGYHANEGGAIDNAE